MELVILAFLHYNNLIDAFLTIDLLFGVIINVCMVVFVEIKTFKHFTLTDRADYFIT